MSLDIISRVNLPLPNISGLPQEIADIHRGPRFFLERKSTQHVSYLSLVIEGQCGQRRQKNGKLNYFEVGDIFMAFHEEYNQIESLENSPHRIMSFIYVENTAFKGLREIFGQDRSVKKLPVMAQSAMMAMRDELLANGHRHPQLLQVYHEVMLKHLQIIFNTQSRHPSVKIFERAQYLINFQAERYPSLYELAEELSISREHLIRIFKTQNSGSPYQLLLDARMKVAQVWLESTDWSVNTIAKKLGYDNSSSFIRTYSRIKGESPLQSRAVSQFI